MYCLIVNSLLPGFTFADQETVQQNTICTPLSLPVPSAEDDVQETGQGLGQTLVLNEDKTKLTVCAPRRISRGYSFCSQTTTPIAFSNVRGICYELNADDNTVSRTLDHCKGSAWKTANPATTTTINFGTKGSCLQLKHSGSTNGILTLSLKSGATKTITVTYSSGTITISVSGKTVTIDCEPVALGIGLEPDGSLLYFYCEGVYKDNMDLVLID